MGSMRDCIKKRSVCEWTLRDWAHLSKELAREGKEVREQHGWGVETKNEWWGWTKQSVQ